jgi:hypothetical protein
LRHVRKAAPLRWLLLSAVIFVVPLGVATESSGAGALARSAAKCSPPKYPGHGYFSSLSVSGTSCATGRQLVVSFYRCRLKHGAAGRCRSHVLGFTCTERRQSIPTELDARVTCHRGHATVIHTYQQDL